jgi:hypothetical protein
MRRTVNAAVLMSLFALAFGCSKPAVREKPGYDPLVMSKGRVEGKSNLTNYHPTSTVDIPPAPQPQLEPLTVQGTAPTTELTGWKSVSGPR